MEDTRHSLKITVRLSPYEARELWRLRTDGLPDGARPRTITQVVVTALLEAAARSKEDLEVEEHEERAEQPPSLAEAH